MYWPSVTLHRPPSTGLLADARAEVRPPSLRQPPPSRWRRALFWLLAPAPLDAAPPVSQLSRVRKDFQASVADLAALDRGPLWDRIARAQTQRELWHLRAEVFRVVALAHSQQEAEYRLEHLNRHFPTRSPRSGFTPLL